MPSPFPGMNPFLGRDDAWPDLHHRLIDRLAEALADQDDPRYLVKIEEQLYVQDVPESPHRPGPRADVALKPSGGPAAATPSLAVLEAPARIHLPWPDVEYQAYLEVSDPLPTRGGGLGWGGCQSWVRPRFAKNKSHTHPSTVLNGWLRPVAISGKIGTLATGGLREAEPCRRAASIMIRAVAHAFAAAILVTSIPGLASANHTFSLTNVTLVQGSSPAGTLTGMFTTDNSLSTLLSANLTASPAGPTGGGFTFPGTTYTLSNSSTTGTSLPGFFQLTDGSDQLRLIFNGGLTTAGATISTGSFEAEPGAGNRTVATGAVVAATAVPEASSLVLGGIAGVLALIVARGRRRAIA